MLNNYLTQSATIIPNSGSHNTYGVPTAGTAIGVDCRIEEKVKYIRNKDMQQEVSTATIYLSSATSITIDDKILYDNKTYEVIEVTSQRMWGDDTVFKEVKLK